VGGARDHPGVVALAGTADRAAVAREDLLHALRGSPSQVTSELGEERQRVDRRNAHDAVCLRRESETSSHHDAAVLPGPSRPDEEPGDQPELPPLGATLARETPIHLATASGVTSGAHQSASRHPLRCAHRFPRGAHFFQARCHRRGALTPCLTLHSRSGTSGTSRRRSLATDCIGRSRDVRAQSSFEVAPGRDIAGSERLFQVNRPLAMSSRVGDPELCQLAEEETVSLDGEHAGGKVVALVEPRTRKGGGRRPSPAAR